MKKTALKLIFISACLILVISAYLSSGYAWLVPIRDSMVVVSGNIEIEIDSARYAFAREVGGQEHLVTDNDQIYYELDKGKLNTVPLSADDTYVFYEFRIKNLSQTDASLSLRLSDFSSYLFDGIADFASDIEEPLSLEFKKHTAKNVLKIKYLKYSYNAYLYQDDEMDQATWNTATEQTEDITQLWNFSYGKFIFDKTGLYDALKIGAKSDSEEEIDPQDKKDYSDTLTIRLAIANYLDQTVTMDYYNWLTTSDGYCWNYCKNVLGDAYDEELVQKYLEKVRQGEEKALSDAARAEENSADSFQLTINYFEFVGENIPYNDNEIKDQDQSA